MSEIIKDATFSKDKRYRWMLSRTWNKALQQLLFIGINPSPADHIKDDATIRKLCYFTNKWGYGGFRVINLFSYVSTEQSELNRISYDEATGGKNFEYLTRYCGTMTPVVLMWGDGKVVNPTYMEARKKLFLTYLYEESWSVMYTFRLTKNNNPGHPLYLPATTELKQVRWDGEKLYCEQN